MILLCRLILDSGDASWSDLDWGLINTNGALWHELLRYRESVGTIFLHERFYSVELTDNSCAFGSWVEADDQFGDTYDYGQWHEIGTTTGFTEEPSAYQHLVIQSTGVRWTANPKYDSWDWIEEFADAVPVLSFSYY
jgi:hypothetical protein